MASRPWTVLLYMGWGGDKKFEDPQRAVLEQLEHGHFTHVDVVYQFARHDRVERGLIRNRRREILSRSPYIEVTDPNELTRFIDWASEAFPSSRTALFVKDHGIGSRDRGLDLDSAFKPRQLIRSRAVHTGSGILRDGDKFMALPAFRQAIEQSEVGRFDVLGLDACQLGEIEVAYELRDTASFWIASESSVDTTGWAYRRFLDYLEVEGDLATPRALARKVVEASTQFTLVALELAWIQKVAHGFASLAKSLMENQGNVLDWMAGSDQSGFSDGIYVTSLLAGLRKQKWCDAEALTHIENHLDHARVRNKRGDSDLGVYFPWTRGSLSIGSYGASEFARHTGWAELVGALNYSQIDRLRTEK